MAFHEVQFPPTISYGAVGGPGFHTTVLTLASGFEKRNIDWSRARAQYDVAHGVKTQAELNLLLKFFVARRGKAYGFRFKDWSDFRVPYWETTPGDKDALQVIGLTDSGTTSQLQVFKTYSDIAAEYDRPLYKLVTGTFSLYSNGTVTTDYTVDLDTGIVTLGATLKATTGHVIACSSEFDVPVRFDTDDMKVTIADFDNFSWGQIPLVELRVSDI